MKALYFAKESRKLRYDDNRNIVVGGTHTIEGKPECCKNGLHASKRAIDALNYAPGCIIYLVELSGGVDYNSDKIAATERKYLAEFDATELLKEFARKQALINIDKAKPYFDSEEDFNIVLEWLSSGDPDLRESAAESAESACSAWSAARSAAESAWSACSAARSAAWSAARSAAESAESARSAAWSAESACSAWSAARSAAESAANNMLCEMIEKETGWDLGFSKDNGIVLDGQDTFKDEQ